MMADIHEPETRDVKDSDGRAPVGLRVALIAATLLAIGMGILFFRSQGPLDEGDTFGAMLGAEALSVVALAIMLIVSRSERWMGAATLAFLAAIIPTCEGVAGSVFPGGAPAGVHASHPPPLDGTVALVGLVAANVLVMILAALQLRGGTRKAMLVIIVGWLALIGIVKLIFR